MASLPRRTDGEAVTYKPAFFAALEKRLDASHLRKCEKCGVADGERRLRKNKKGQWIERKPAVVRLALRDVSKPADDVRNVGMYCLKCRPAGPEWQSKPRKVKPSTLPQLF